MHPKELKDAFDRDENIAKILKHASRADENTEEIIETAYDLQAGTYVGALENPEMYSHKVEYGAQIVREILELTKPGSVMEAGVGEGTTCSFVMDAFGDEVPDFHAFDISWSRIACCRHWLRQRGHNGVMLSVASLLNIPYADSSIDVVYTSHTVEPNGGKEKSILTELFRVASRYLVLLEPGYELASEACQKRMEEHGYCKNLAIIAEELGMKVLKHELFPYSANPMNPTAITVIEKNGDAAYAVPRMACPRYGDPLADHGDSFFSEGSFRAYPKIKGIPCLRLTDGVVAGSYHSYREV